VAAFAGLLINLAFFVVSSRNVYPYFLGSDIVFVFAWVTMIIAGIYTGTLPSFDLRTAARLSKTTPSYMRRLVCIILGIDATTFLYLNQKSGSHILSSARYSPAQRKRYAGSKGSNRREFIISSLKVVGAVVSFSWLLDTLHWFPFTTTTTATASSSVLAKTTAIPVNTGLIVQLPSNAPNGGDPCILIHQQDGSFVAYDAVCTHAGCTVGYDPGSGDIICPCHGAVYDPAHGAQVLSGPAPSPLTTIAIKVDTAQDTITLA
jgi:thiosulfate dehydrogenase [quinone] large subunit